MIGICSAMKPHDPTKQTNTTQKSGTMQRLSSIKNPRLALPHLALALALCAVMATPGTAPAQNLVGNGDLENAAFAPLAGESVQAEVSGITGWSLSSPGPFVYYVNGEWVGPSGTTGHWLLLQGTMSQTITNLPAGTYTFSFDWFRRRPDVEGGGEEMAYLVSGPGGDLAAGDTTSNQTEAAWHHVSQTVTLASAGDVTISCAVTGNDWGIGMDNMVFAGPGSDGDKAVNGNLETDAVLAPNDGDAVSAKIPGGITDWSLTGRIPDYFNGDGTWGGGEPSDTSSHWLLLYGTMSQTIADLPAGTYTFSFDWFRRRADVEGSGEEMAYQVTGPGGLSITGDTTGYQIPSMWHTESQTITLAAAGDVTISFAVSGNDWGIGIDKIALAAAVTGDTDFTSWALKNGVTGGPNGDSDHDGIPNLVEYALILNPAAADGAPGSFDGSLLSFAKRELAVTNKDISYAIEISTNLRDEVTSGDGGWHTVTTDVTDTPTTISYILPNDQRQIFARLKVVSAAP
jgi:hypothetical protein